MLATRSSCSSVFDTEMAKFTWGVQVLGSPNFFLGMEADRNVKVVGGDVPVL